MKKLLTNMYEKARLLNNDFVSLAIKENEPLDSILDVGCWDGELTMGYVKICHVKNIYGIEIVKEMSDKAEEKGIKCFSLKADVDVWPMQDNSIDCVISNQVIEHLSNPDHFFSEAARVLKGEGILITSTNNLGSWHNIFSLFFGWAPFDLTNSSTKVSGIGNPLANHKMEKCTEATWTHRCVYTPKWLFEWQDLYGLKKIKLYGAGFYPLSPRLGNLFKNHSAFMILVTKKITKYEKCN